LSFRDAIGDAKTMKNVAEDAAVVKELVIWSSKRNDVVA
jgi:hypothetical protein